MGFQENRGSKGSAGCGCFLLIFAAVGWGICLLMFPKMPDYDKTMERGTQVPGKVLRLETVENVEINGKNPRNVIYRYGDGKEGSMRIAMGETASQGQEIQVRVLGEHAYPEGIEPFMRPWWVTALLIGMAVLGSLSLIWGVVKLLLIGGVLATAGGALLKKKGNQAPPPPPPPPPPAPPA